MEVVKQTSVLPGAELATGPGTDTLQHRPGHLVCRFICGVDEGQSSLCRRCCYCIGRSSGAACMQAMHRTMAVSGHFVVAEAADGTATRTTRRYQRSIAPRQPSPSPMARNSSNFLHDCNYRTASSRSAVAGLEIRGSSEPLLWGLPGHTFSPCRWEARQRKPSLPRCSLRDRSYMDRSLMPDATPSGSYGAARFRSTLRWPC